MLVGTGDDVTTNVEVGVEKLGVSVGNGVCVEKLTVLVGRGTGVSVGTLGTQRTCPTKMVVDDPMQLPACNRG